MQVISEEIGKCIQSASWIRRMFEAGIELKQKFGADEVCDFTLGNPDLPPVPQVAFALRSLADTVGQPLSLGYMPNAGLSSTRQRLAEHLAREQKVLLTPSHVIVTCGAAGGLNVVFRAVLEQDDEVICPSPYFVEYGFYAANYRGKLVPVPSKLPGFSLDVDALEAAITPKTRVVLIDSPNNPTGVVYSQDELKELAAVLVRASQEFGRPIYLVSDEPYRFLTYDAVEVPPVLPLYPFAVAVGSFSKSLSLAGERIGYIAVNPAMPQGDELIAGLILCNRILGYVNAPVIGQRVVDLGAAPGGWSQIAAAKVKSLEGQGQVVAIDYLAVDPIPGVEFVQLDFTAPEAKDKLKAMLKKGGADVVLSDMAAPTVGHTKTDHL
ncbi:MAG TPA: pyridoxal phosphate-dependent aminotransferase, partial [Sedimentisphaerales bacterium]|nr:pyridoxal phosphate-dependent aminotransferase [Sedimentisphaerales bacterium]